MHQKQHDQQWHSKRGKEKSPSMPFTHCTINRIWFLLKPFTNPYDHIPTPITIDLLPKIGMHSKELLKMKKGIRAVRVAFALKVIEMNSNNNKLYYSTLDRLGSLECGLFILSISLSLCLSVCLPILTHPPTSPIFLSPPSQLKRSSRGGNTPNK